METGHLVKLKIKQNYNTSLVKYISRYSIDMHLLQLKDKLMKF